MRRWRDWLALDCMEIPFGKSAKLDSVEVCTHVCRVIWKKIIREAVVTVPQVTRACPTNKG